MKHDILKSAYAARSFLVLLVIIVGLLFWFW